MDSKKQKEQKVSERGKEITGVCHGIAKDIPTEGTFKLDKNEVVLPRRQPVKNINFTTRADREAEKNG